jgi:hypothetical protein
VLDASAVIRLICADSCAPRLWPWPVISTTQSTPAFTWLWPITFAGHTLRAEAIWMVRSPHRQDSHLMSRFEALLPKASLDTEPMTTI